MTIHALISRICSMPREFHHSGKSMLQLLAEAGFYRQTQLIKRKCIEDCLDADPTLIEDWVQWSADKKTGAGWYFESDCTVGYYPSGPKYILPNMKLACVEFIVRELGDHYFD